MYVGEVETPDGFMSLYKLDQAIKDMVGRLLREGASTTDEAKLAGLQAIRRDALLPKQLRDRQGSTLKTRTRRFT